RAIQSLLESAGAEHKTGVELFLSKIWLFSPLCSSLVHHVAFSLAYCDNYDHQHLVAHFINQTIACIAQLDLVSILVTGESRRWDAGIYQSLGKFLFEHL